MPSTSLWTQFSTFFRKLRIGDISNNNYSDFESDGTLEFLGDATVWDDLRFPFTQSKLGSNDKPDFDYTNIGLLFPQNDASEKIYILAQLEHKWKLESTLHPHLHWVQTSASFPTWKMSYRWYENGGDPTGSFTTLSSSEGVLEYPGSGTILQMTEFGEIDGTGIDSVSSMLDIIIWREDDTITGDVLAKEFDIHIEIDTVGSRQKYTK